MGRGQHLSGRAVPVGGAGSTGTRWGSTGGDGEAPLKGGAALVGKMGSRCGGRSPGREGQNL